MSMHGSWGMVRSLTRDSSVAQRKLAPGTAKRVMSYARPYKSQIGLFLVLVIFDSALVVATPLLLGQIIDKGVRPGRSDVVVRLSLIIAVIAVLARCPDPGSTVVLLADRGGAHLRPAHPGVQPRPEAADRLLHQSADRGTGQQAEQ